MMPSVSLRGRRCRTQGRWRGAQDDDGPAHTEERGFVFRREVAQLRTDADVAGHQREGLVGPVFAASQLPDRGIVGCVAGQEKSAEP